MGFRIRSRTVARWVTVALGLGIVFPPAVASAGPIFDITAITQTVTNTSPGGTFAANDVLMGSIELSDAASMPGAILSASDILSFSFTVGSLMLTSANSMAPAFRAIVSDTGDSLSFFRLLFTTPGPAGGCDVFCRTEFGRFANGRDRVNVISRVAGDGNTVFRDLFGAQFAVQRRQVAEPAGLALLGLASLAGLATRRSKARRRA